MELQNYESRQNDAGSKRLGTFSYLPEMSGAEIRKQVQYMISRGWNCAVEHVEPARAAANYWYMWKLPLFGEGNVDTIMNELTACRNTHADDHIRIIGYDNNRQTQGLAMVVSRGK
jgi:ribulose-bisphosphate carboxylase small chain